VSSAVLGGTSTLNEIVCKKPRALIFESVIAAIAPASPGNAGREAAGLEELKRLGFQAAQRKAGTTEGYFAGSQMERERELTRALANDAVDGVFAVRGGYGSNYLLDGLQAVNLEAAKAIVGFSDLTSLQIYLWQKHGWVSFYGPMLAAGLDGGAGAAKGYDRESLLAAIQKTDGGWKVDLHGEVLAAGNAEGRILGGCMTLVETTLGTPWELDTREAILLLEDRGMKPWQVDRGLMHLKQAGKFEGVRGIVLGDFPECEPPVQGSPTVRDVAQRILVPLDVPIVFGAPVGHTLRPMLTLPLGVKARLSAKGEGLLEIVEPAVVK
jgi:muramoyltetrapeptide carboxypeptidase